MAEAKTRARDAIRSIRYSNGAEYLFVFDFDGVNQVMGPRPEWEGTRKLDLKDAEGKPFIVDLIDAARRGGGTVDYVFPRAGTTTPEPKVSWAANFAPWQWMIGTGVYVSDVDHAAWGATLKLFSVVAVVLFVAAMVAILVIRGITRPLADLTATMTELAGGNLDVDIPDTARRDEIGTMADSVQVFQDNAREVARLQAEQAAEQRRAARRVRCEMLAMTNALDEEVQSAMARVLEQADAMSNAARAMAAAVTETEEGAAAAANASQGAATSVDAVAAAAEELTYSITEISTQVTGAVEVAGRAATQAEVTNTHVAGLASAADAIGTVVNLISDVAKQTNLLALNASIEAARAGEAGKGFAVVANEVKTLANQTASATEDIARQIEGIQTATRSAVDSIRTFGAVIDQLNETSAAISAAVEEQSAATGEISQNAHRASEGTQHATAGIAAVSTSSRRTGEQARSVQESSEDVRARVRQMRQALETIMRSGKDADRDANRLRRIDVPVTLARRGGAASVSCTLRSLACAGVGTLDGADRLSPGEAFDITLPEVGSLAGSIVARTDLVTHIRLDVDESIADNVETFVRRREQAGRGWARDKSQGFAQCETR
ncbi:methyl-accepting chemotaxis protein [Roseospira marina]|nr:methyl-accepting chemotaxis protein [Roseospira marina]MBB5085471.1 methyl-accepting chemotaxis protein [Roseospira marina]